MVMIEDGILKGFIQDRLNARLMGLAPTGNGRRQGLRGSVADPADADRFVRAHWARWLYWAKVCFPIPPEWAAQTP